MEYSGVTWQPQVSVTDMSSTRVPHHTYTTMCAQATERLTRAQVTRGLRRVNGEQRRGAGTNAGVPGGAQARSPASWRCVGDRAVQTLVLARARLEDSH